MKRIVLLVAVCALALVAITAAACGGDDDAATPTATVRVATSTHAAASSTAKPSTTAGASAVADATTTASGLKYVDHVVGTGATPKKCQIVTIDYVGTLADGTTFDSSIDRGSPYVFQIGIGSVVPGMDDGVSTMQVGGKRTLYIPSALGYGTRGRAPIPPNADIVFDVTLLKIAPSNNSCS
jgi:peptidylprolyl isomerase